MKDIGMISRLEKDGFPMDTAGVAENRHHAETQMVCRYSQSFESLGRPMSYGKE